MPGLVGIVSKNALDERLLLLDRMVDSLKHKEFYRVDKHLGSFFGIARVHLGIFNPEPQPIFNEDKTLCIFMYGKIYGYEEEMENLKHKHTFTFDNDPEFCLHAYEEYGVDFVKKLNGSFVLIICNFRKKELVIINDRYGLHPLYYTINNGNLLFAPEIKAILQDVTFKKELNDETIADFFAFGNIFGNKTFFKGIEVLPPASIFIYDGQAISTKQYWNFNYDPDYTLSEDELADKLVKTFRKAVEIRMKDNLRYGVSLSGGLDSRSVVGAINKEKREEVVTFTFGIPECGDVKVAKTVSEVSGTKHTFKPISASDVLTPYPEKVVYFTEGMLPIQCSHQTFVYENLKPHLDVLFDGLALDLLLGGSFLNKQIFKVNNDAELIEILNKRRIFSNDMLSKLSIDDYYNKIKEVPLQSIKNSLPKRQWHPCNKCDYVMLQNHVRRWTFLGIVFIEVNGIEDAAPTYDNDFIDVILKIPPELRFRHRIYRKFLKKLAPELARIPYDTTMVRADAPLILWRVGRFYKYGEARLKKLILKISMGKIYLKDKSHFAPVGEWLRVDHNWKKFARDILLSENAYLKDFFRQEFIKTLIEEHESGRADHFLKISYLITFELFLRMFVEDSLQVEP